MGQSVERADELSRLEDVIHKGRASFMEVGEALAAIRDDKLYKDAGHRTFDAYCAAVWGFTANYARRQITASATAKSVPTGTLLPKTEREARALAKKAKTPTVDVKSQPKPTSSWGGEAEDRPDLPPQAPQVGLPTPQPEQLTIPWAVPHSERAARLAHDDIAARLGIGKALSFLRDEMERLRAPAAADPGPSERCRHPKDRQVFNGTFRKCGVCLAVVR